MLVLPDEAVAWSTEPGAADCLDLALRSAIQAGGRRRPSSASFFTVVVGREQAEHATESPSRAAWWWSKAGFTGVRLAEDGTARSAVEVVADELGPSLRWAIATPSRATRPS